MCFAADFAQKGFGSRACYCQCCCIALAAQMSYSTGIFINDRTINGAAADVWSSGVVYAMLTGEAPFKPLASASIYCDPNSCVQAYEDMLGGMRSWVSHQKPTDGSLCIPVCNCHTLSVPYCLAFACLLSCLLCATRPHTMELAVRSENAALYLAGLTIGIVLLNLAMHIASLSFICQCELND